MKKTLILISSFILFVQFIHAETEDERMIRNLNILAEGLEDTRVKINKSITKSGGNVQGASRTATAQIKKYNIMQNNGASLVDLCLQSSMISQVLLNEGHEQGYKSWNRAAVYNCQMAKNPPRF